MAKAKTQLSPREMYRRIKQAGLKSEKLHDFTRPVVRPRVSRASESGSGHGLNQQEQKKDVTANESGRNRQNNINESGY